MQSHQKLTYYTTAVVVPHTLTQRVQVELLHEGYDKPTIYLVESSSCHVYTPEDAIFLANWLAKGLEQVLEQSREKGQKMLMETKEWKEQFEAAQKALSNKLDTHLSQTYLVIRHLSKEPTFNLTMRQILAMTEEEIESTLRKIGVKRLRELLYDGEKYKLDSIIADVIATFKEVFSKDPYYQKHNLTLGTKVEKWG